MTEEPDEDQLQLKLIAEAGLLSDVVEALDPLVDEARVHYLDELIRIWAVGPANAAGVYIDLKPSEREDIQHYAVQPDGLTIGMDIVDLKKLLSNPDDSAPIGIEHGEKHQWKFNLQLPNASVDLAGIDSESIRQEPDKPELGWPATFDIEGEHLKEAIDLNDMFSDHFTMRAGDHQVDFFAEGDTDGGTYTVEEPEEVEFIDHPEDTVESMFSTDYLSDMAKVLDGHEVRVRLGDEWPVMLEADLFTYMMAPRIQSD